MPVKQVYEIVRTSKPHDDGICWTYEIRKQLDSFMESTDPKELEYHLEHLIKLHGQNVIEPCK